jgi:hypothetical protein
LQFSANDNTAIIMIIIKTITIAVKEKSDNERKTIRIERKNK